MATEAKVNIYRTTARVVGVVYLAGFIVGIVGNILIQSVLNAPNHLPTVSASSMTVAIGAMLWLMAAVGDAAHGVLMFPILKQHSEGMAIGYLAARIVDATFIAVMVLCSNGSFHPDSNTTWQRVLESNARQRFLSSSPEYSIRTGEALCLPDRYEHSWAGRFDALLHVI